MGLGLHVTGETQADAPEYAFACHLERVLQRLDVSINSPSSSPPAPPMTITTQNQANVANLKNRWNELGQSLARVDEAINALDSEKGGEPISGLRPDTPEIGSPDS